MEEFKIINELFARYGITGVIIAFLLWDKFIRPMQKKSRGEWVDYNSIQKDIAVISTKHDELEKRIKDDLEHNYNQHANIFGRIDKLEEKI